MNPGSKEAKEKGCTCDEGINHYGKGLINHQTGEPILFSGEPMFWKSEDCSLHGPDRFAMEETYGKERHAS